MAVAYGCHCRRRLPQKLVQLGGYCLWLGGGPEHLKPAVRHPNQIVRGKRPRRRRASWQLKERPIQLVGGRTRRGGVRVHARDEPVNRRSVGDGALVHAVDATPVTDTCRVTRY